MKIGGTVPGFDPRPARSVRQPQRSPNPGLGAHSSSAGRRLRGCQPARCAIGPGTPAPLASKSCISTPTSPPAADRPRAVTLATGPRRMAGERPDNSGHAAGSHSSGPTMSPRGVRGVTLQVPLRHLSNMCSILIVGEATTTLAARLCRLMSNPPGSPGTEAAAGRDARPTSGVSCGA
jgi:hypothetical protein